MRKDILSKAVPDYAGEQAAKQMNTWIAQNYYTPVAMCL